ncbi:MAG: AAA family ATPase [Chloroflexi bacterium]|nr:AAA family ATPase [Chloroflexota bacterium]
MIITRLTIKRLRAIREEKVIDFSPGLNIIKGSDNEAGKSTLRLAIVKALFQDPTAARKEIHALTSWGVDEPWEVSLEFDSGGDHYRLTKSLKERSGELEATGSREFVARNKHTIAEKITETTGCPSEVFFESTACIGQEELIRLVPGGATDEEKQSALGTISKRLQAKLSGGEEIDILALISRLHDKTHSRSAQGPYQRLQEVTERIVELRGRLLDLEEKNSDILEKRRTLCRVRDTLAGINRDLAARQESLGKDRRIAELEKDLARDRAQHQLFREASALKERLDSLDSELAPFALFTEDRTAQLEDSVARSGALTARAAELERNAADIHAQRPAFWLLPAGAALGVGGLAGALANPYALVGAFVGYLAAGYWFVSYRVWKKQADAARQKLPPVVAQLEHTGGQVRDLLAELGCRDFAEFRARVAHHRTKMVARRDAASRLDALVRGQEWPGFAADNAGLDSRMSAGSRELEALAPFRLEPAARRRLEDEIAGLLARKAELDQEPGALEKFLEYATADKDDFIDLEEELSRLEQERELWERRRRVFDLTREMIEEAHRRTFSRAADLLETEVGRYIAAITDARYSQVKIDESDLSFRTFSPEKNDWVDVRQLSRGTQDQFYICARLALVSLITDGKRPPILLDDPFVNFHAMRLRRMIALLQTIARDNQVLLFTCCDAYDYVGQVISLD